MSMHDLLKKIALIENSESQSAKPQQKLNEKYMGFDKTVAAIKKGGSAENPEAVAAAIGREKYGKERFQKAAAAGKKLGEERTEESALQAYLGKKKYGEEGMKALQQAGRDGASKEEMAKIRAKHDKMDEQQDVAEGMKGQVVFSGSGADGSKYEIIQTGPTDFMIHANGKHIDTYSSLQRAMSVLRNEVSGLKNGVAEGLPGSLSKSDYTSGKTVKHTSSNCTACHGRKTMYKLDGKLYADNKAGATKVKCPTCKGTGDKQGVAEGKGSKPDFLDLDKDGDRAESMKKAAADKEKTPVKESWTDFEDAKKAHEKAGSTVTGRPDDYTVTMMDGTRKRFITKDGKRRVETLPPVQKRSDDEDDDSSTKSNKKKETKTAPTTNGKRRGRPPGSKNKKISEMTDHEFHGMITYYKLMESELSDEQKTKKEEIAKAMKDSPEKIASLKKRYGKRWKNVVFATATKKAKETVNEMIGDGYFIIFTGKDWDRAAQGPYRSKEDAERANPAPPDKSKIVNQNEFARWKEAQVRAQPTPGKKKVEEAAGALARLVPRGVSLFRGPQRQPEKFMGNVEVVNPRRAAPTGASGITPKQAAAATAGVAATGAGLGYLASRDRASAAQPETAVDGSIDYSLAATDMQGTPMSPNALPGGLPAAKDQIDKNQQAAASATAAAQRQRDTLLPSDDARSPDGSSGLPPSSNRLPAASAVSAVTPSTASSSYQVARGDTLSQIAQRNNTSVRELIRLNPEITNPDVLRAGQKINVAGAPQATYAGGVGTAADTQAKIAAGKQVAPDMVIGKDFYTPSSISDRAAERAGINPSVSPVVAQSSSPVANATQTGLAAAASDKFMDPYGGSASNTFDTSKKDNSVTPPAEAGKGLDSATDLPVNADNTNNEKIEYTESIKSIRKLAGLK